MIYVYENALIVKEGPIYEEYSKYLSNARDYKDKLIDIERDINIKHGSDIQNIKRLIAYFNDILNDK